MGLPNLLIKPMEDAAGDPNSSVYGFVVDHPAFWGIPIPHFSDSPAPTTPDSADVKKLELKVDADMTKGSKWTQGQIRVFATRMPPLFHALHHNTLVGAPRAFIPREKRGDLPEAGEEALVGLCTLDFAKNGSGTADARKDPIPMKEFYREGHGGSLISKAQNWNYFEVENHSAGNHVWDVTKVGPLGALWIVLLNEDGTPAWFDEHLGGGYRLWHYKNPIANGNFFRWNFRQSKNKKNIEVDIDIGVTMDDHKWKETIGLKLKLEWL